MRTRQIPRAEWFSFFDGFTRRHRRSRATVWLLGSLGAQVEARDLPLENVACDALATSITIQLGGATGRNVEHPVPQPVQVWLETTDEGADAALAIDSADGSKTVLEFGSPAFAGAPDAFSPRQRKADEPG